MKNLPIKILLILLLSMVAALLSMRSYHKHFSHIEKQTRFMLDTFVTIHCLGPKKISSDALNKTFRRIEEINVKFSSHNPKSPVWLFNNTNQPITDPEILSVIRTALKISEKYSGAFDITVAPLLELWGFYTDNYRVPSEQEIKYCLNNVGYQHLRFPDNRLEKDNPAVKIDLGGVAKGFAIVEASKTLKANGVNSFVIDIGGDVYVSGKKRNKMWKVGIEGPRGEGMLGYVEVEDLAVMGSGDYERFFIKDGKRYHHIFNPKTGYPTEGVISVTVIYHDPVLAQVLAKLPFLLGPAKGLEELEKVHGMEVIIITAQGEKFYSAGLKQALKIIPKD